MVRFELKNISKFLHQAKTVDEKQVENWVNWLLSIESIKQPFLSDNLKSILSLSTLALLYRIGSCRNEETIDNENAFKLEKKPS